MQRNRRTFAHSNAEQIEVGRRDNCFANVGVILAGSGSGGGVGEKRGFIGDQDDRDNAQMGTTDLTVTRDHQQYLRATPSALPELRIT